MTDKSTEWVVVADGVNPAEAEIIRARLESNDIPAIDARTMLKIRSVFWRWMMSSSGMISSKSSTL